MELPRYACLTGIRQPEAKAQYCQQLHKLGFTLIDQVVPDLEILVLGSILTQKCKIARLIAPKVRMLDEMWLRDSNEQGIQVDIDRYEVTACFHRATIGLYGFDEATTDKISQIVQKNGGAITVMQSANMLGSIVLKSEGSHKIQCLVLPEKMWTRVKLPELASIPIVGLEWVEASMKYGHCRFPIDYAYNYLGFRNKGEEAKNDNLMELKNKLMNQSLVVETTEPSTVKKTQAPPRLVSPGKQTGRAKKIIKPVLISRLVRPPPKSLPAPIPAKTFSDCMVYFHEGSVQYTQLVTEALKPLVCMLDGLYLQQLSPLLTHVIVDEVTQKQYHEISKFGTHIPILRVEWVIDKILLGDNVREIDYKVRSFKEAVNSAQQIHSNQAWVFNQVSNSRSISSNNYFLGFGRNVSSTSTLSMSRSLKPEPVIVKKKLTFKTCIFKGISFYIPSKIRKDKQLKNIVTIIRQNGGVAYDKPKLGQAMYCVLTDGPDMDTLWESSRKGYEQDLLPVSHRWIKYCAKRQTLMPINSAQHYIFSPFRFQTPIFGFLVCRFEIMGVGEAQRSRIRELLDELGSKKNKPSISEITHCLCGSEQHPKMATRIQEIKDVNTKAKFIRLQWLFACVAKGQMISVDDYKCQ